MPPRNRQRPAASSSLKANPEPLMTSTPPSEPAVASKKAGATPEEELVYLSARVPKSLRTELQLYAVREGVPVVKLVQDAVRAYLDAHVSST